MPTAPNEPSAAVSLTIYLPAATIIRVLVTNYDGVAARDFFHATFVPRVG